MTAEIQAGDLIAGLVVAEVAEDFGWRGQTAIFLTPEEWANRDSGREWVLKES